MAGFKAFASEWGVAIEFSSCGQRGLTNCGQKPPWRVYCSDFVINSAFFAGVWGDFCEIPDNRNDRSAAG